ncbi:hypothetical protein ACJO73_17095 [Citrobacter freundii]|uniref:hypothetical protein n=1 Tax=Citrobacter freundii TaxID=546 RepID=UPI0025A70F53|nr:hypothetical protein [Citrobacter freundii]
MSHIFIDSDEGYYDYELSKVFGWVLTPALNFKELANSLDCQKDFHGVGIIYNDGSRSFMVRPPSQGIGLTKNKVTHIIITKISLELPDDVKKTLAQATDSSLKDREILSTALSCGAMVLWGIGTFVADTATVTTFGAATPLAVISTLGTMATAGQCINGGLRLVDIYTNEGKKVKWLDSQEWYNATIMALDLISLAGASRDLYIAVKTYRAFRKSSSMAMVSMKTWLSKLSNKERVTISRGIIKHFNPAATGKQISMWLTAGKYPKMIDSEQAMLELNSQINNAIMVSMAFSGSTVSGVLSRDSLSGTKKYAIGVLRTVMVIQ